MDLGPIVFPEVKLSRGPLEGLPKMKRAKKTKEKRERGISVQSRPICHDSATQCCSY